MRRVTLICLVIAVLTAACTPKIERELHACFAQCAKAHEEDSLPRAQCNDLCAEKAKPTPTPASQDLAKIETEND